LLLCLNFREEMYPGLKVNYTARVGEHHFLDNEDSQVDVQIEKIILYPGRTRTFLRPFLNI